MLLKTQVIGNIGNDAIIRDVNGKSSINFSVAYNDKWKDKEGNKHEETIWINCTLWRKEPGTLVNYLKKGTSVYVEGKPSMKTFQDKHGVTRVDFALTVQDIRLLASKKEETNTASKSSNNDMSGSRVDEGELVL